jgi:hypothetical protein
MRKRRPPGQTTCKCGKPARPGQRNCSDCHAAAQRRYRKKPVEPEELLEWLRDRFQAATPPYWEDLRMKRQLKPPDWLTTRQVIKLFRSEKKSATNPQDAPETFPKEDG